MRPGLNNTSKNTRWDPVLDGVWHNSSAVVFKLRLPAEAVVQYGAPASIWFELLAANISTKTDHQWGHTTPADDSAVATTARRLSIKMSCLGKRGTRLPEAMWVKFNPVMEKEEEWVMDKMGQPFSFSETAKNGSRYLHGIGKGLRLMHKDRSASGGVGAAAGRTARVTLTSLDAALAAPAAQVMRAS